MLKRPFQLYLQRTEKRRSYGATLDGYPSMRTTAIYATVMGSEQLELSDRIL
jgi:hypothetical protein